MENSIDNKIKKIIEMLAKEDPEFEKYRDDPKFKITCTFDQFKVDEELEDK